jgi:hypothetical protein
MGSRPDSEIDELLGYPVVVTVKVPVIPTAKVAELALVIAGACPMVTENVSVAIAPLESLMATEAGEKVPTAVGVPVSEIVLPEMTAVSPAGSPLAALIVNGPVPPLTAIVPGNPDWFTVQAETVKEPRLSGGSMTTETLSMALTPRESSMVTEPDENALSVPTTVGAQ